MEKVERIGGKRSLQPFVLFSIFTEVSHKHRNVLL